MADMPDEIDEGDDGGVMTLKKAQLEESEMDITPMIDCTFLLLIFFIVCSRIQQQAQIALPPARNGDVMAAKDAVVLTIVEGNTPTASVYKGDGPSEDQLIPGGDPVAQEQEITRYVEESMRTDQKINILVKAERKVKHREVSRVIKAATQGLEIQKVHVAVQQSGGE
ncbi:MAG: hypothetical protein RIS70_1332 [Planctomycetota bacterium]|jgi:biopolymer transport protein ExbD